MGWGTRTISEYGTGSRAEAPGFSPHAHRADRVTAWREALFYGALIAALFAPFDLLHPDRLPATLALRAALIGALALGWWWLGLHRRSRAREVMIASGTVASVLTAALVVCSDRAGGLRFGFALALPFLVLSLVPDLPAIAVACGAIAALAGGGALALDGWPWPQIAEWTTMAVAMTALTALGARRIRMLGERAEAAERGQRTVLAQLEESERRRAASERLALIGRLAAGVGHEINNPLAAVMGNVACAIEELQGLDAAPGAREALAEALAAGERIAWITSDMRALVAGEAAPLVPCAVDATIRDGLARAAARLADADVQVSVEAGLPCVRSDPRLLGDAVAQLAAQAAAAGAGRAGGAGATVRISARRAADGVEIAVEDEGPRIPANVLQRVFEPFATQGELRGAGLGLALPLTRELAERSGGRVGATWHERGNRFVLTLSASTD